MSARGATDTPTLRTSTLCALTLRTPAPTPTRGIRFGALTGALLALLLLGCADVQKRADAPAHSTTPQEHGAIAVDRRATAHTSGSSAADRAAAVETSGTVTTDRASVAQTSGVPAADQPAVVQPSGAVAPNRAALAALAASSPYFDAKAIDLGRILPPPPSDDSATTHSEIELMLKIQQERSPQEVERARADASYSVFRFADALGNPQAFNAQQLPKTTLLFRKVTFEEGAVVQAGKRSFSRPRPFVLDTRIQPILKEPTNASYPSGHAMWSRVVGLLLADMLPEYRDKIMARADDFAFHRVVAGVHYPSDVEAGKHAGTALAAFLLASPAFQSDYTAARQELRAALKLTP